MDYTVHLRRHTDGTWTAVADSMPGCAARARSREAALDEIRRAIKMYVEGLLEERTEDEDATDEGVETTESVVVSA